MSSFSHKRAWEAPVAIRLPIRSTAGTIGSGADNFMRVDPYHRPGVAPTAPLADVGAVPVRPRPEAATTADADQHAWESPTVTTSVI